jgi:osmotically-inducible protein OsmY
MIAAAAIYYWKARPATLAQGARQLGSESSDAFAEVGQKLQDAKTNASVHTALGLRRSLKPYSIDSDTRAGLVTLRGEVAQEDEKALASRIASSVPDVREVRNELRINPALAPRSSEGRTVGENLDDKALEIQVNLAFSLNRNLKGTDLKVRAYRRDLTVGGVVDNPEQRALAIELARETPGVADVADQIQLRGQTAAPASMTRAAPAGDGTPAAVPAGGSGPGARAAAARRALSANANLAAYPLSVREDGGRLTLNGTVRTPAERDLAALIAKDAAGVPVDNAVLVRP